jgi:hypothetical protein
MRTGVARITEWLPAWLSRVKAVTLPSSQSHRTFLTGIVFRLDRDLALGELLSCKHSKVSFERGTGL